ncbi:MAG: hypothetical protein NZM12_08425, partial [Steroidobacteraceae bacterium]|nr:hypothetical protein [Steroidobacteraceae bacterium]MDW8258916.1 hypothetical protein [Gammaproteobacteria bacterium]
MYKIHIFFNNEIYSARLRIGARLCLVCEWAFVRHRGRVLEMQELDYNQMIEFLIVAHTIRPSALAELRSAPCLKEAVNKLQKDFFSQIVQQSY